MTLTTAFAISVIVLFLCIIIRTSKRHKSPLIAPKSNTPNISWQQRRIVKCEQRINEELARHGDGNLLWVGRLTISESGPCYTFPGGLAHEFQEVIHSTVARHAGG